MKQLDKKREEKKDEVGQKDSNNKPEEVKAEDSKNIIDPNYSDEYVQELKDIQIEDII